MHLVEVVFPTAASAIQQHEDGKPLEWDERVGGRALAAR